MELYKLTIKEALEGLKKKLFSTRELVYSCQKRIDRLDTKLNAFITIVDKVQLTPRKGALAGIPIGLKDLYVAKGIRTTAGSRVLENFVPQYNATVVRKLLESGAVILGKTNLDAWGHGSSGENSDFGPAKNPWNTDYVPGGSSSGSAVAVASDMCLAATGTDTGGSLRLPASFCSVVGLKPTYGRVSRFGVIAMASSHDCVGHLTKTVYDSALLLGVMAGFDHHDATTAKIGVPDYTRGIDKGIKGVKIGIPKEYFNKGVDPQVERLVMCGIAKMEDLGANVCEISLPITEYALAVYYILQPSEVSSNLARFDGIRYGNSRSAFGSEAKRRIMLGTYTLSAGYYDAYYSKAMKVRTLIKKDYAKAFEKVDVIVTPVSPTLPFKFGEKADDPLAMYLSDVYTVTVNLSGSPSLAIPCGFAGGLPVGMQIIGPHFSEGLLLRVGYAYEQATDWYRRKPNL